MAPEPSGWIFQSPTLWGKLWLYTIHFATAVAVGFSASILSFVTCRAPLPSACAIQISNAPVRLELQIRRPSGMNPGSQSSAAASVARLMAQVFLDTAQRSRFPLRFDEKTIHSPSGE